MRYISEELMTEYLKLMIEKAELVIRRSTSCMIYTQIKMNCKKSVVMQSEAKHLECSHVDAHEIGYAERCFFTTFRMTIH